MYDNEQVVGLCAVGAGRTTLVVEGALRLLPLRRNSDTGVAELQWCILRLAAINRSFRSGSQNKLQF